MLNLSELPEFTIVREGADEPLQLSRCAGKVQWLSNRIAKEFPAEKRLGIICPTSPALVLLWLATLKAGKEPCILQYPTEKISKDFWRDSLRHTIGSTQLEGLIHDAGVKPYCPGELTRSWLVGEQFGEATPVGETISEGAVIQLSSGTTGYKKGIRLTLDQLRKHVENYNRLLQLGDNDTIVSWLPLYHDMGFIACFVMPLLLKLRVVMMDPVAWVKQPGTLFHAIRRHQGTVCYMPNFGFEVMSRQSLNSPLSTMRHWISCSEPTHFQTLERFCQRTGANPETVSTCYGMAENVFAVSQSQGLKKLRYNEEDFVSCGKVIPGTQVKVVDGELFVKSDTSLQAYVGTEDVRDADGFYATGDLGSIVDGELVIFGRKRDAMISAGKKYFLNDLDYTLGQIIPDSAGRIASLSDYNADLGTETVTFLIERPRFWERDDLQKVSEKIRELTNLETFQVHFVPPLFITKTSSGKINRKKTLQDWKACLEQTETATCRAAGSSNASARFLARVNTSFSSLPTTEPMGRALDSLGSVVMRLICDDCGLNFDPSLSVEQLLDQSKRPVPGGHEKVFSIVALVDGIKLGFGSGPGFLTEQFIAEVSKQVGMPVSVEHVCVPPAPVLFSDVVFHDYFMPRDAGEKYSSFSAAIQKIKNASLILIDDEDSFRMPPFCVYPRLSHRFNNEPDADLLGHRLAAYTLNHHLLAREVVAGRSLSPGDITPSIHALAACLNRPVMKLAFHKQFQPYTKDWDYTEYRQFVSDADYRKNPVNSASIQSAIQKFIRQNKIQTQSAQGATSGRLTLKDPPHFCSFLINRQAVDYILGRYESFCIGGLPSSVPCIEQQLKAAGKRCFYSSTTNLERDDFDCMLLTGFSGAIKHNKPYFDFMHVGDEGGKPHNVTPEIENNCPPLVAGSAVLINEFRSKHNDLVPIGNWILNYEMEARAKIRVEPNAPPVPGTILVYGPVYARSGYGLLTRSWALALHQAGLRVRVMPVDCRSPKAGGNLDDCDLYQLRKLEHTEIRAPVTAIYSYVPIHLWPRMALPEPNVRIMLTTYDSNAQAMSPPHRLVYIVNQMDQVWLPNVSEAEAWIRGGVKPELIRSFRWPNDWMDNAILGPATPKSRVAGKAFRFLHVSVFFPRRRIDILIAAFFEEFRDAKSAELYLKVGYPTWHPRPQKPKQDLHALIEHHRQRTGSNARIIVDESVGTRMELARLFDSCDFYVSTDTASTAPVSEALFRCRLGIITDGWNVELPPEMIVVKNSPRHVQITQEMAEYMPHHRGGSFPALEISDVRTALRQAFSMKPGEQSAKALSALQFMRDRFSSRAATPAAITAIQQAWQCKMMKPRGAQISSPAGPVESTHVSGKTSRKITWCGLQLFHGKVPALNRGLCLELLNRGHRLSLRPSNGPFHIDELSLQSRPEYLQLADRFYLPLAGKPDVNVSSRWHPIFSEEQAGKQVMINTWWSGSIPVEWAPKIKGSVDEIWVPSHHVRDNFLSSGIPAEKLWLLPLGVDTAMFRPDAGCFPLKTRKNFKFLFVGETSQRKGFDLLLKAYLTQFSHKDDVCLVVKDLNCEDYYARNSAAKIIQECQSNPQFPEIEYLDSMMGEAEMASLYSSCDCFVQPFRTASFPLAVLEAMACGLPVITTGYGGALEICNEHNSYILPAREIQRQADFVGHWRVNGPQRHGEIEIAALQERMRRVFNQRAEAQQIGKAAREHVCERFDRVDQANQVEQHLSELCERTTLKQSITVTTQVSCNNEQTSRVKDALPWLGLGQWKGSVAFVAPFYNRSGYGVGARAIVAGLQAAGVPVRIVPVNEVEQGINDCDMAALKAMEKTPITSPVATVFFHVPHANWLKMPLPENSLRIMYTTFDSSAQGNKPPQDWIEVCRKMDQVWLMTSQEAEVFRSSGIPAEKIKVIPCPHPWINNSSLPMPVYAMDQPTEKFRFLSMAMFLPRRRWDTLIEAFLSEFSHGEPAELYLKVNYPAWHPVPGQPKRDLRDLIQSLREKTGSKADIIVDEDLGTRLDICRIIDSCHAYASTDTASTAPLSEALVRGRMAIIPDGYGANLPYCESTLVIPADPALKTPMTPDMLKYQPHHRGKDMSLLKVEDVRGVLRQAFELPAERRAEMGRAASLFMESQFGPSQVTPLIVRAIQTGFAERFKDCRSFETNHTKKSSTASSIAAQPVVYWDGSFLDMGSLSHVNRELTGQLARQKDMKLFCGNKDAAVQSKTVAGPLRSLADGLQSSPPANVQLTVRHAWPPNWKRPATGKLAVIQPWEFGSLPEEWVRKSTEVDEFWVPSKFVRDSYVASGVPAAKVQVVPNGVDPEKFHPAIPPMPLATKKKFKFLFVGGTIGRKGSDVLLKAYMNSFTATDDVCLVIKDFGGKSVYAGQTFEAAIRDAQSQPAAPEILYLSEELAPDALPGLYTACHCFVLPYRGEGFGLPVLEAMACGLAVIVTAGGATDDFVSDETAFRIPAQRRSVGREISGMKLSGEGWLLEPDQTALAERMKWVVTNPDAVRAKGRAASEHARRNHTWERAAEITRGRIHALANPSLHAKTAPTKVAPTELPTCARLGNLKEARATLGRRELPAAWKATVEVLSKRAFHPEAFLLLAEIALAAGDSNRARECAKRARDMAPAWSSPKQFLQKSLKGNARPDWLTLSEHVRKPKSESRNRLSVCVIAKNEEQFLDRCLSSVKSLADQIIVVDTGSTDRTVEIAKSHGAEVFNFKWCDDFSTARNEALEHVTSDWILMLDADEELPADQHDKLRSDIKNDAIIGYRLPLVNEGAEDGQSYVPRLYRNAPGVFYRGRIHEQVFPSLLPMCKVWGIATGFGTACLLHHGYTKEIVKDRNKNERNLRLLHQAIGEDPTDANLVMNLGLELVRSGELANGLEQYREAFRLMSAQPADEVVPELREVLLTQFTCNLYKVQDHQEVTRVLNSALARNGGLTASLHFALGLSFFELKQFADAAEQMRQCLVKRIQPALSPINTDILTSAPNHCLALSLAQTSDARGAQMAFEAALLEKGDPEKLKLDYARFLANQNRPVDALRNLHEMVSQNSKCAAAWRLGGEIALKNSGFLEFGRDWTGESIRYLPDDPGLLAQRAEVLLLSNDIANAKPLWERACSGLRSPRSLAALILCATVESEPLPETRNSAEEAAASRAFVEWYQRLVSAGATETIERINARVDALKESLPTAARMLDNALAEVQRQPA